MSEENLSLVARVFEEHARTNEASRWALRSDVEWHTLPDEADAGIFRGIDAVSTYVRDWPAAFDDFRGEVVEMLDLEPFVVIRLVLTARIKGGATEITLPETQVWELREGLVASIHEYHNHEEALAAVRAALRDPAAGLRPARPRAEEE